MNYISIQNAANFADPLELRLGFGFCSHQSQIGFGVSFCWLRGACENSSFFFVFNVALSQINSDASNPSLHPPVCYISCTRRHFKRPKSLPKAPPEHS